MGFLRLNQVLDEPDPPYGIREQRRWPLKALFELICGDFYQKIENLDHSAMEGYWGYWRPERRPGVLFLFLLVK